MELVIPYIFHISFFDVRISLPNMKVYGPKPELYLQFEFQVKQYLYLGLDHFQIREK